MKKNLTIIMYNIRRMPGVDWVVLGAGLVAFGALALQTITASSIWFDEAFGAYLIKFSFFDIARYTATDVHPPVYYWLLKIWSSLFGTDELALRSMSILFGMTAIIFAFMLVRRLFGRKAAWVSLLFLVISPMLIRYGQEARMYTLAATIALAATYTLTFAVTSKSRKPWIVYGILVGLGMWTHYFTALVWLSHWVWRLITTRETGLRGKAAWQVFFSKNWIIAHVVAIGTFLPWAPFMLIQLTKIQNTGFWIGPVGVDTLPSYLSNVLFYLEHTKALGMYGLILIIVVTILLVFAVKLYTSFNKEQRRNYLLLMSLAFVPVLLLFIVSMPPLKSSFVERYLIPSVIGFSLFAGVTLTLGMARCKRVWHILGVLIISLSMVVGIFNVYYYGNYNKNSSVKISTRELIESINAHAKPGEPIIAGTPWIFYEAVFYNSATHPVYFIDADTQYIFGSLDMLKNNNDHKIKDLPAFTKEHPVVWYIGNTGNQPLTSPRTNWTQLQALSIYNSIDNNDPYKAAQYIVN